MFKIKKHSVYESGAICNYFYNLRLLVCQFYSLGNNLQLFLKLKKYWCQFHSLWSNLQFLKSLRILMTIL